MPPRGAPPGRGGRGAAPARGGRGGATRGGTGPHIGVSTPVPIATIGVRRPEPGTAGKPIRVQVNAFVTSIPEETIRHYDVVTPDNLPSARNMEIMKELQSVVAPQIFTPPAAYDGRKNVFATRKLALGDNDTTEFNVSFASTRTQSSDRPPKVYKVKFTLVAEINAEVLRRFIQGKQSHDNTVLTAITAMNVVVRMAPSLSYPYNVRSFFTPRETKLIGRGIELWRGYFQSVRPAMNKMIINVDISTGMMYRPGPLIQLCLDHLGATNVQELDGRRLSDRERMKLSRFLSALRVVTSHGGTTRRYSVKRLSKEGADALKFEVSPGREITVASYFKSQANLQLRYPSLVCVETPAGAFLPLELCEVKPGQLMKKEIPPELTKEVVEFATLKPAERLRSITQGLDVLAYGQSEYVRNFGMTVQTTNGPLTVAARVLPVPTLRYNKASAKPTIQPRFGAWNLADKALFQPATLNTFAVMNYEPRLRPDTLQNIIKGFLDGAASVQIPVTNRNPVVRNENAQGSIVNQLISLGEEYKRQNGTLPQVIVVILPDNGNDIYKAVKYFGDVRTGCITQCLKASKCSRANIQYWANVMLKLNTKIGGINSIAESQDMTFLTDPNNPTVVMGADVIHPAPGTEGRPSYTALVSSLDMYCAKYIATNRVQTSRQEIIDDLQEMTVHCLRMYLEYRMKAEGKPASAAPPKRLIFYRDGVSEGQFKHVLELELPLLKAACAQLKISPKITMIIVGKRHHVRMFPSNPADADRSGNCPAGTIIDTDVAHPTEFDFYLCSHSGLLGTSRPAHYSVLVDENNFKVNALQSLTFALCHVYARATRSVSIPAPVYYADLVCARAGTHYDPTWDSERGTHTTDPQAALSNHQQNFKVLHAAQSRRMYFS